MPFARLFWQRVFVLVNRKWRHCALLAMKQGALQPLFTFIAVTTHLWMRAKSVRLHSLSYALIGGVITNNTSAIRINVLQSKLLSIFEE